MTQGFPKPNEVQAVYHHQRTSSDSFLLEEQPSWFEELLNDESVEAPVTGNHRRSLSDSFTYLDATPNIASKEEVFMFKDTISTTAGPPPKASNHNHELNYQEIMSYAMFHTNPKSSNENEFRESSSTSTFSIGLPISTKDAMTGHRTSEAPCIPNKSNSMTTDQEEPNFMPNGSDCSHANPPAQNKDSRRSKQQATHGSRVRKLRYIVQLERHLRALQAKGSQVSAELEFLDRHYLILGMENRALKHQLDCLMQEQFIKCLEQDMLEREVARLRNLYQQQQQQQQQSAYHGSKITDPECQHENLFVRH